MIDLSFVRGFFPPVDVLCAMKFSAILGRAKGRDYYDAIFLLSKTQPCMAFLAARSGISTMDELKVAVADSLKDIDLHHRMRDFSHLLFNGANAERVLRFPEIVAGL